MKYLLSLTMIALFMVSCTKDNEALDASTDLTAQLALEENSNIGTYKGVFTTNDSETRAIVEIFIPSNSLNDLNNIKPSAVLTTNNGEEIKLMSSTYAKLNNKTSLLFTGANSSFIFKVNADGTSPIVSDVIFDQKESFIMIAKNTLRAPVNPITGTYSCVDCNDHPVLNSGVEQTYNLVVTEDPAGDTTASQVMTGSTVFMGTGTQDSCTINGTLTTCDINGTVALPGGTTSSFIGSHIYNNEDTALGNDCSQASGTWSWVTSNYGTITGNFQSDVSCLSAPEVLAVEDFDGTTPTWVSTPDIAYFTATSGSDFWGPSDGTTGGSAMLIDYNVSGNFLYVQDLNNTNGGTTGFATLNFADVDVTNRTSVNITFDYDVFEFDAGDDVEYVVTIDGIAQPTVVLIQGVNNGGTTAENTETISIPDGSTTVSFLIRVKQNGAGDYAGFDNFKVEGI